VLKEHIKKYIKENINRLFLDVVSEIKPPSIYKEILIYLGIGIGAGFGIGILISFMKGG